MRCWQGTLTLASAGTLCFWLSSAIAQPQTAGWRGDGTGKYPAAQPPTTWSRVSKDMEGLRYAAGEPAAGEPGAPMPDGVVRQWLVLGPVPLPTDAKVEKDTLPTETEIAPDEGQATGGLKWNKVTLDSAYLDFARLIGKPTEAVAYACTHIYAPAAGAFCMNLTYVGEVRVLLNGKACPPFGPRYRLELQKGWNRIVLKVSPGSKEATGVASWYTVPVFSGWGPCEYRETNIAWRRPLPGVMPAFYGGGTGVGAPVIVGQRLYVPTEPHDLACLRKTDGKVLWLRRSSYFEAATDEEKTSPAYRAAAAVAAKLDAINVAVVAGNASPQQLEQKVELEKDLLKRMKRVDADRYAIDPIADVGYSGFTPVTDGHRIYTWSASGISACYDLDGHRRWIRIDRLPEVEHGFSSSPLLVDGKLVVFMRDLIAFDAETGKLAWQIPLVDREGFNPGRFFHGSLVAATIGKTPVIALGNATVVRASDGKILCTDQEMGNQSVASPVVDGRKLFLTLTARAEFVVQTLPETLADPLQLATRRIAVDLTGFPTHYLPWHLSSPIVYQGLAYLLNNAGVLTVIDVERGTVVYQKLLDLDPLQAPNEGAARGIGASPALAGDRLYFLGNNGTVLVLAPGRVYRQIAKNKIESVVMLGHWAQRQERFMANPVFDGKRLYLRGEGHLYAIEPE